jgi:hypothetical protein
MALTVGEASIVNCDGMITDGNYVRTRVPRGIPVVVKRS